MNNSSLALKLDAAKRKRSQNPYAIAAHLKVVHSTEEPIVRPSRSPAPTLAVAPVSAVSVPEYEPGFFVRVGDAVIRQLGFTMIVSAIVGMTIIGYWTGFNERVALDAIASVIAIMDDGLEPKIVVHDWDEVTGERVGGCDSPQTTKAGCRPQR